MLSKSGNPTMGNVSAVFAAIKRALEPKVPSAKSRAAMVAREMSKARRARRVSV